MKVVFIPILLILLSFCSCSDKEGSKPQKVVLEQQEYLGPYALIKTELISFDADMKPIVKVDTFFYGEISAIYARRSDSTFITSSQFSYDFETQNNGTAGEISNHISTFTNAGTEFQKTDTSLIISGYTQQGSRTQTTRKFSGIKL
ncbi:hypothetical protein OAD66_01315 [Bacteroidia bacterium]|nr:hypothetical protein [Bacteroidia bacterium]MDB9881754.1 hypothetical protein [Bacteroidia bacterium]